MEARSIPPDQMTYNRLLAIFKFGGHHISKKFIVHHMAAHGFTLDYPDLELLMPAGAIGRLFGAQVGGGNSSFVTGDSFRYASSIAFAVGRKVCCLEVVKVVQEWEKEFEFNSSGVGNGIL